MNLPAGERSGVLCVGTLLVDYGKVIDDYPSRDGLATIEDISLSTGGAALNMAVDLRRLGARFDVSVMGCVADDDDGDFIRAACADAGIDAQRVRVQQGATTAFTDVMVERDGGRRTFFTHLGTNALFRAEPTDLAGSDDDHEHPDHNLHGTIVESPVPPTKGLKVTSRSGVQSGCPTPRVPSSATSSRPTVSASCHCPRWRR